ncbi:MAG: hypothetical protein JW804_09150 [Sedimentisphaerales bacterium]|nr:hypothetical protein [Sedimentisphaerales bacterium]
MNEHDILQQLLPLLEDNGITIRNEPLAGSGGGLCTVKDKKIFFVDTHASSGDNAALAAQAVNKMIDIESVYLRPEVRQFVEKYK